MGTGRWHFWAQVVILLGGTGGCIAGQQVGALVGTGGRTAGHKWVHCWAQVGGTCVWHCWALIIRALVISDPDDRCQSPL
ncbi:unnamed protein product [Staurois parvus]|uniref:Secreted protein n=1 Tax=Staurois parvus TaxID=386267 RepID=A0ABN9A7S1_9NEOB|nr:unnamed protein product [Staurois parvus]